MNESCRLRMAAAVVELAVGIGMMLIGLSASAPILAAPGTTGADAVEFVNHAESDLSKASEYLNRSSWVQATYITPDTSWLYAKAFAEATTLGVRYAKSAHRFDHVPVDAVTRRKLDVLKQMLTLPVSSSGRDASELAEISARLATAYSTTQVKHGEGWLTLDETEDLLAKSRDPNMTRELWEGWHNAVGPKMKADYARMVALTNRGAREIGYADTGELWRSWYDMPPTEFEHTVDELWGQVAPLYESIHCFVRAKLNEKYGESVQPGSGPIRADLLGDMWGQAWGNIPDVVGPVGPARAYDFTAALQAQGYDAKRLVQVADHWYQSIGLPALPSTFWERSQLTRPRDREVVCHGTAEDIDNDNDIRMKACLAVTENDFYTVHHELGHLMYYRAYAGQPFLFKAPANDGFDEAIGDFAALNAEAPGYLKRLNIISAEPDADADMQALLQMSLDKLPLLAFAMVVDKWRWGVFAGSIKSDRYNEAWWDLVRKYQYLVPPGPRPSGAFDPGAKYHVAGNVPYARYFLAVVFEFQFYRAACRMAGWRGPLNRCSVDGNAIVGQKLQSLLRMGRSRPWPEALAAFTGERKADASALIEYFAPLTAWLEKQKSVRSCVRSE